MEQITETQQTILKRYINGPQLLTEAIAGLNNEQMSLTLTDDSWSICQLIHHITDGDYLWKEFLLRAVGDPEREFSLEWYWCLPQDEWVKRWSYAEREVSHSVGLLKMNRQHTYELLKQVPWLWEKSLLISTLKGDRERVTVSEVIEMQCQHVEGHVKDITQIRRSHGL